MREAFRKRGREEPNLNNIGQSGGIKLVPEVNTVVKIVRPHDHGIDEGGGGELGVGRK